MNRLIAIAMLATASAFAETPAAIESTEKAWAAAVTKNDFATLDKMMSDSLIYVHSTGIVETKAEYTAKLKSGEQKYTALDYSDTIVKVTGGTAVLASKIRMRGATKNVPFDNTLRIMHTWAKEKGAWRLVAHQTARLPQ